MYLLVGNSEKNKLKLNLNVTELCKTASVTRVKGMF